MPHTPSSRGEKRDFIRMRIDTEVSLLHEGQVIAAVCLDLSSGGMQVQAPQRFRPILRGDDVIALEAKDLFE